MLPDIAFSTVLAIVVILLPGLTFRRFYYANQFAKEYTKGEWNERVIPVTLWGVIINSVIFLVVGYFSPASIQNILSDFGKLSTLTTSKDTFILWSAGYVASSTAIGAILGYISYKVIRGFRLDIHFPILRYSNQWHYHFYGELTTTQGKENTPKGKVLFPWLDVALRTNNENKPNKMVQGVLVNYSLEESTGNLEYLYLEKAHRYCEQNKDFKRIPGDLFVVPFNNVVDMNIRYERKSNDLKPHRQWYLYSFVIWTILGFLLAFTLPWLLVQEIKISTFFACISAALSHLTGISAFAPPQLSNSNKDKQNNRTLEKENKLSIMWMTRIILFVTALVFGWLTIWFLGYQIL